MWAKDFKNYSLVETFSIEKSVHLRYVCNTISVYADVVTKVIHQKYDSVARSRVGEL